MKDLVNETDEKVSIVFSRRVKNFYHYRYAPVFGAAFSFCLKPRSFYNILADCALKSLFCLVLTEFVSKQNIFTFSGKFAPKSTERN